MKLEDVPQLDELEKFINCDDEVKPIYDIASKISDDGDYFPLKFSAFDLAINGGITEGDLVIISGRTGQGKTTFAQTLTYNLNQSAIPCLWFSYEMSLKELWKKFEIMGCDQTLMAYAPLKTTSGRLDWLEMKIREGIVKYQTKVIFIDHLGFLSPNPDKLESAEKNYAAYLTGVCRQLKKLAIDKNVIVVLLAHTRKTDKDLDTDDIAYSYGIAQEADFVFMVERQKPNQGKKFVFKYQQEETDFFTNETKIKLVKNRRTGQSKIVKCNFVNSKLIEITNQNEEPGYLPKFND